MSDETPSITCPVCAKTSYHPKDIEFGYCAFCNEFTTTSAPVNLMDKLVLLLSSAERAEDGPFTVERWNKMRDATLAELANISINALAKLMTEPQPDQ